MGNERLLKFVRTWVLLLALCMPPDGVNAGPAALLPSASRRRSLGRRGGTGAEPVARVAPEARQAARQLAREGTGASADAGSGPRAPAAPAAEQRPPRTTWSRRPLLPVSPLRAGARADWVRGVPPSHREPLRAAAVDE